MKKNLKKIILASMGALFVSSAFAGATYNLDSSNLIMTVTLDDGSTYTYQFSDVPTTATSSGVTYESVDKESALNYIFANLTNATETPNSAFWNKASSTNATVTGAFIGNTSTSGNYSVGGVYNGGTMTEISGIFVENSGISVGAVWNAGTATTISGTFIGNKTTSNYGGAIYNSGTITTLTGTFDSNYSAGNGGAIYNSKTITNLSGTFTNNEAKNYGGAIFNTGDASIGIVTNGADTVFSGNTDSTGSNAITNNGTITFSATDGYSIIVDDVISRSNANKSPVLKILAGTTVFNNIVSDHTITVSSDATLALGSATVNGEFASANLSASYLTVNGTLSLVASNTASIITLGTTTMNSGSSLALDLSDIFGSFTLTISGTELDFSDLGLDIVLADGSIDASLTFSVGDYDVSSYEGLDSLSITSIDNGYTISGTVAGTAVPEPSTYAMIFGVVALGFAYYRRRK